MSEADLVGVTPDRDPPEPLCAELLWQLERDVPLVDSLEPARPERVRRLSERERDLDARRQGRVLAGEEEGGRTLKSKQ